ncbi:KHDRBS3 [Lepeophtheirus salmonis]|uniref:KHDRBS3 n=1 Tax=Lepeophtheirus salmonis TaxID=72036 RepID=A0A7R8CUI0_LEPSM|nr:KHDRBS3 [Lepeophtheirus salmonis]CAF2934660.1 KHDRBS3 [Lepeophtheirus salmonis]
MYSGCVNYTNSRGGKPPGRESKFVDIYHEKPIRLTVRVIVPVREHPKFNFVGKLLGPKGNSMKRLQEETLTKMAVLGRGSMRNKQQEEELRKPKTPTHARIAYALTEVRKYLIPDSNDEIRQKQMREIEIMNRSKDSEEISSDEHGSTSPSSSLIAMRGLFNNNNNNCSTSGRKGTTILPHGAIVALNGNGSDVTTSKVRVYSILDKIRANSLIPNDTQAPAYVETINLLDKNGFTYEDLENVGVSSDLSSVTKAGFKERSRCIRMQIAPYPTRHK